MKPNLAHQALAYHAQPYRAELLAAGWHLYEEEGFGISGRFKNGKPKKTPSVWIRYFDRSTENVLDLESGEFVTITREFTRQPRPWRVDSWRFAEGKSLADLPAAFALFLEEAGASDPFTAKGVWAGH